MEDIESIYAIINDAARAYKGVIPPDRYHEPYMPMDELRGEMERMTFFGWEENGDLIGVMGFQPTGDVTLIRHAYVLTDRQREGIGSELLNFLKALATTPRLLVGTWTDAHWAIKFYEKHGFQLLLNKEELLRIYWDIPDRQIETSVVLGLKLEGKSSMREVSASRANARYKQPYRVVLAVSVDEDGKANIISLGWSMFTSFNPPMLAISVGKTRYSHKLISKGRESVLAVPGEDMSEEVLYCGTHSGRDVDKFEETGLIPRPAKLVKPPLIEECIVNQECKVVGQLDTGDHTIFVGKVVTSWVSDDARRNLLSIGREAGYKYTGEGKGYHFGVVKTEAEI